MTNLLTATNAAPSTLVSQYIPTTGAAQYTVATGTTTDITSAFITNTDPSVAQTVKLIIVKAGGSAATTPPILPTISLAAGATVDIGQLSLGDGDSIWAQAGNASKVGITLTGIEFSSATGAVLSGIQDDAIGTFGRTAGSSTVTSSLAIGSGSGRRAYGILLATSVTGTTSYTAYDTLTLNCTAGAMTRLVSCDFNNGGTLNGSVHIFELIDPTSASTQTLTATVAKSGVTFNLTLASMSLSGVANTAGAATSGPTSAAVLSLPVTSATGHRTLFAGGFDVAPMDFNKRVRAQNGNPAIGFPVPHWLLFGDALGASTNTFTLSNSQNHCAVGIDLVPA